VPLDHLLKRSGTLLMRASGPPDEYGDPTDTEVARAVPCDIQQLSAREANEDAAQVGSWRAFLPASAADLTGWDALTVDGVTYELAGAPWPVFNPRLGVVDHVEAALEVVA